MLFWKDVWLAQDQESPLSEIYPRALSFATNEDESICSALQATNPATLFHLPLSAQAREEVREIQRGSLHVIPVRGDADIWVSTINAKFSAKSYYNHCFREMIADEAFTWLWRSKSPIKFKMFGWLLLVDRLNTRNMLKRRNYVVANNNYACLLCQNPPEETVEHPFFNCPFSRRCWDKVGLTWPHDGNRISILHEGKNRWRQPLFMDIFLMASWSIWKERNNEFFRGVPHSFAAWLDRFKHLLGLLAHNCKEEFRPFLSTFTHNL